MRGRLSTRSTDMKIALVLTDSSLECERAFRMLAECARAFSAEVSVHVILEDLYRLQSAGISLGIPLPPDTVGSAKEKAGEKVRRLWRRATGSEEAEVETHLTVGELLSEVRRFTGEKAPDMIVWGCVGTGDLCRILEEIDIPSLIIK